MLQHWHKKSILGFTAIEIAMVATVIAILALIVLPLFRKRSEEAKLVAAQDDMRGLRSALVLANADTNWWFRLQDLDNTMQYNSPPLNPDTEVPLCIWNRELQFGERQSLATEERWQGPYTSVSRYVYLAEINSDYTLPAEYQETATFNYKPYLFYSNGGPILDLDDDSGLDKLPVDPWGNPYLFFGPGRLGIRSNETSYSNAVIYSLGPNGAPGNVTGSGVTNSLYYTRESGVLGTGDDLFLTF